MTRIRLKVIPEPEPRTRTVLSVVEEGLSGPGPIDLVCGLCGTVLAGGVPDERLEKFQAAVAERIVRAGGARVSGAKENLVLRCPTCGACNELAPESEDG